MRAMRIAFTSLQSKKNRLAILKRFAIAWGAEIESVLKHL